MERQHQSQTKNAIAASNRENALVQLTEGIARNSTHPVEKLQGAIGNQAVNRLLANQPVLQTKPMFKGLSSEMRSPSPIQTKLAINAVGDKYEQGEVIQRAKQVQWGEDQTKIFDPDKPINSSEEEEEEIARIVELSKQEYKRQARQSKEDQKKKEEEKRNAIKEQITRIQERNKNQQ